MAERIVYQLKRHPFGTVLRKAIAGVLVLGLAGAVSAQELRRTERSLPHSANTPLILVVSLNKQRLTVYSDRGKILEAPVSSGRPGYDTPAGIYSILQRRRDHYSNLYNDAAMPFMQRLTWSGIALHAGDLPGYPASHGCIRMPFDFAGQLFGRTRRGMRVVVMRHDMSPVEFAHPALFKPAAVPPTEAAAADRMPGHVHLSSAGGTGARLEPRVMTRRSIAAAKQAEAEAAAARADELRRAAAKVVREAEPFEEKLWEAESVKKRALAEIAEVDFLSASSPSLTEELKSIKAKSRERLAVAQAEIDAIGAEGTAKIDAARSAREEIKAAEAAKAAAQKDVIAAVGRPVSVFISRKTQRLYVRQGFEPVFESPVTISNPGASIGTIVYTAMDWSDDDAELRWTALSMHPHKSSWRGARPGEALRTSPEAAKAALERITIPEDAIERVNELVTPGSSLIVSDEGMSKETGEATDFIVVMGGQPQGGIARRKLARPADDEGPFSPGGGFNFFSWWN